MPILADIQLLLGQVQLELSQDFLGKPGQRAGFLVIAGLLGGFLFIRTSARLIRMQVSWWPGNVETSSGLHIHHLVWGILTIMLTGFLTFSFQPDSPWIEILAVAFGIGCGLTLDEFALWLHLEDVYWSEEGRSSVDAVIIAVLIGWMLVVGAAPFDSEEQSSVLAIVLAVTVNLCFVVVVVGKGKLLTAILGALHPAVGDRRRDPPRQARLALGEAPLRAGQPQAASCHRAQQAGGSVSRPRLQSDRRPADR